LYREQKVESMPWFNPDLDPDLVLALNRLNLHTGTALDLGTGPGTQAIALAERGFKVTATDISATAVQQAQRGSAIKVMMLELVVAATDLSITSNACLSQLLFLPNC
jgi:methylase of polypeptide subunit release factors